MKNLREYSKRIVHRMIVLWFCGAIYGAAVVAMESAAVIFRGASVTVHLPELLTYIGAPVGGGILVYLLKSAFENREKIKKGTTVKRRPPEDVP